MAIEEEPEAGIPEWVVTFGDMMSLLLTFFIMLTSMSEIKEEQRYQAMVESMRQRFGHEASMISMIPGPSKPRNSALAKVASMGRAKRANTMNGGDKVKAPVGEHPRVMSIRNADQSTTGGVLFFDKEDDAELTEAHRRTLQASAQLLGGKPQKIEVRGHTSSQPLPKDSPYKSRWELSFERASRVADFLVELGIDRKRIRIAAAADNEPMHIGNDPLLQKKNNRVEVTMLNELVEDLKGSAEEKNRGYSGENAASGPGVF
ncbi:MAG TPA: flagellar motor protein MotB [Thermoguttaceae bacterium]|nr:flagellar motor protein MotB [Thermoguttaceae bacterium]